MKTNALVLAFSLFSMPFAAFAQDQTPSETSRAKLPTVNKKFEENTEITDAKIRAESGSRSRFSLKFNVSYYGPTLNDFSQKRQPNPDKSNAPKSTALAGGISTRLRTTDRTTLGFGTGIKAVTPTYGIERFDVNNPSLNYDYTQKFGALQARLSPGVQYITTPEYRNTGETMALNFDQSLAYQVANGPLFITLDGSLGYFLYERGYNPGETRAGGDGNATRYSLSVFPGAKYRFTDALSLSTSVAISVSNPRSQASSLVLWRNSVTQRLALGWAITRDIYIQPYVDMYPQALAIDTTTANISTIFSIL